MTKPPASIAPEDLQFRFIRAAGPGGQNVNKVATAVQLRFDLARCRSLPEPTRARLRLLAGRRLTADGAILITSRAHRSQEANRREALLRLGKLIEEAGRAPAPRIATRVPSGEREQRLRDKRAQQRIKRLRSRVADD